MHFSFKEQEGGATVSHRLREASGFASLPGPRLSHWEHGVDEKHYLPNLLLETQSAVIESAFATDKQLVTFYNNVKFLIEERLGDQSRLQIEVTGIVELCLDLLIVLSSTSLTCR